jgi:hypothetical protein
MEKVILREKSTFLNENVICTKYPQVFLRLHFGLLFEQVSVFSLVRLGWISGTFYNFFVIMSIFSNK